VSRIDRAYLSCGGCGRRYETCGCLASLILSHEERLSRYQLALERILEMSSDNMIACIADDALKKRVAVTSEDPATPPNGNDPESPEGSR
jgi:hypothetical protein